MKGFQERSGLSVLSNIRSRIRRRERGLLREGMKEVRNRIKSCKRGEQVKVFIVVVFPKYGGSMYLKAMKNN